MRLTAEEASAIKAAAREAFGPDVVVRLFGSRVHDQLRGGDIDLHFEVDSSIPDFQRRSAFLDAVEQRIDGRKIDTVFSLRDSQPTGFERIAYRDGVIL